MREKQEKREDEENVGKERHSIPPKLGLGQANDAGLVLAQYYPKKRNFSLLLNLANALEIYCPG